MTYKNAKTILFASLLVAMILPFSGILMAEAAPNENANDKAKENTAKQYKAKILSSIVTDVYYDDNDNKIQRLQVTVKTLELPTFAELVEGNQDYYDWLTSEFGERGEAKVKELKKELKKNFDKRTDTITLNMVRVGEHSIIFGDESFDQPNGAAKDPVNMVFYDDGSSYDANRIIDNYADNSWGNNSLAPDQYVLIDDGPHGGSTHWETSYYQQYTGNLLGTSTHVRIYDGGYDTHGVYGEWSIGTAHEETWNFWCLCHEVDSWEDAELDLKNDLSGETGVGSVGTYNQGNSGTWQDEYNNGIARLIQLT